MAGQSDSRPTIAVVGGGVIGLATALTLQRRGLQVTLIDRDAPGQGCSSGNAAVIASSFVMPLSSIGHLFAAPRMLLNPLGPLSIRVSDLPELAPWLARFALNALPVRQRRTIDALKAINSGALRAWRSLLAEAQAPDLLIERGMLDVIKPAKPSANRSLTASAARLASEGIALDRLSSEEIGEMEPLLDGMTGGGVFHRDVAQVRDPNDVNAALLRAFVESGGRVRTLPILSITPGPDNVTVVGEYETLSMDYAVLSAGYWSGDLLRPLGISVPIGTERGYSLTLRFIGQTPSRPISFHEESFLATPISGGLRLAGTVELARAEAAPNWRRADQLAALARRYIPNLDGVAKDRWMGCRPSFPDSLPAIGRLGSAPRLLYAFGHQHLGLTQAAVTAEAVASMLDRGPAPFETAALSLSRFRAG